MQIAAYLVYRIMRRIDEVQQSVGTGRARRVRVFQLNLTNTERIMELKIESAKLWMDGSSNVSVIIAIFNNEKFFCKTKVIVNEPTGSIVKSLKDFIQTRTGFIPTNEDLELIFTAAETAREDPNNKTQLVEAVKRVQAGKKKSLDAMKKRLIERDKLKFKSLVKSLMINKVSKSELIKLINDSIIEDVMEK